MLKNKLTIKNNKLQSEVRSGSESLKDGFAGLEDLNSFGSNFFRYSLIVEYIGEAFFGSQRQPCVKTVQSELEFAIKKLLQCDIKVIFSGRTDRGVHAKNQVVHFNVPFELNIKRFLYSLNAILSEHISVKNMQKVNNTFHSQISAKYRWYRYVINNRPYRSVWLDKTSSHVYEKLNVEKMQIALDYLIGKHDFTSFKSTNTPNPVKECNMYYARINEKSGVIKIDLIANRFLYNMVRIITGTIIEIGKGIYPPEHMMKVLESKNRTCAGHTAEACGLTLMAIGYEEKHNIKISMENNNEDLLCKAS
jgi:tRNA pseudouridine38-40 synthase